MDTLRALYPHLLAADVVIDLGGARLEILSATLAHIDQLGDIGFRLEVCVDAVGGHSLCWDNRGTREQDSAVDDLMERLAARLWPQPIQDLR